MGRPKRFTAMQPDTEKSSTNSYESRPKRFKITPATENSTANSRDSRPFRPSPTKSGACSRPFRPSPTKSGACSRPFRPSPTKSGACSRPSRPSPTKSGACSRPSRLSPTKSGACSRLSRPSSNGSAGVVTMPPTQVPDYTSSDSSDDDDDEEEEEEVIPTSIGTTTKSCKKKSYWTVNFIDEGDLITEGKLKVRDIWSLPTGKKIIIPCDELSQPIDDAGGLLGGFLGDLGSDFTKFPMCYKSWRKVPVNYKNTVYDDIIQKKFLVEDMRLKDYIMRSIGKKWKDTRCSLYRRFYNDSLTLEENIARRPCGIDLDQWTWFLLYRKDKKTQVISKSKTLSFCLTLIHSHEVYSLNPVWFMQAQKMSKQNAENRRQQQYTHTNGSKSIPRRKREEELKLGRPMSRGELWILTHKDKDNSYMNEAAKLVGEQIERIESMDGTSKKISEFDSVAQVLGKEHPGRVRGVGYGPCPTQVFGKTNSQFSGVSSAHASRDRNVEEMKLKVQKLEALVESERSRSRVLESFLARYLVQQGMDLPPELAGMFNATASGEGRKWTNFTRL